jgi:hypothetical protein
MWQELHKDVHLCVKGILWEIIILGSRPHTSFTPFFLNGSYMDSRAAPPANEGLISGESKFPVHELLKKFFPRDLVV